MFFLSFSQLDCWELFVRTELREETETPEEGMVMPHRHNNPLRRDDDDVVSGASSSSSSTAIVSSEGILFRGGGRRRSDLLALFFVVFMALVTIPRGVSSFATTPSSPSRGALPVVVRRSGSGRARQQRTHDIATAGRTPGTPSAAASTATIARTATVLFGVRSTILKRLSSFTRRGRRRRELEREDEGTAEDDLSDEIGNGHGESAAAASATTTSTSLPLVPPTQHEATSVSVLHQEPAVAVTDMFSTGAATASSSAPAPAIATDAVDEALPKKAKAATAAATEQQLQESSEATATPPAPNRVVPMSAMPLYDLPPIPDGRHLTKLEREFRDMLGQFTVYSERDILSLRDPRMRSLFRGVASGAKEPAVYRAFEVLYDDLYPLRLAGRLVYKKLKELMEESKKERQRDIEAIVSRTELDAAEVEESRLAFVSVAVELNGDAFLKVEQLAETGLADVSTTLGFDTVHDLLDRIVLINKSRISDTKSNDKDKKQQASGFSFSELVLGLNQCAKEVCSVEECNPTEVMHQVMFELKEHPPQQHDDQLDAKRRKFGERYDEMVSSFREWEDLVPEDGTGRITDVVRGCFVGARNEPVLDALRIVYVDYSPLRMAGDIIFKLVKSFMTGRLKRKNDLLQKRG